MKYTGIDVVESVIEKKQDRFATKKIQFICGDAVQMKLPKADLLICKDVLQHLSNADVFAILEKANQFRYCIFVNDVDPISKTSHNPDIVSGGYRFLDLRKMPFCLKESECQEYKVYPDPAYSSFWLKQILFIKNDL